MVPGINVRTELARKNYTGKLEVCYGADKSLTGIPYAEISSPVRAALHYEIFADDKVEVAGRISFSLKGLCSRCLADAEEEIGYAAEGVFAPEPRGEEYGYSNGFIDLGEFLRDSVLFALPSKLLCKNCMEEESE